jgi:integrase
MSWCLVKKRSSKYWFARIRVPGGKSFDKTTKTANRRTAERVAERIERDALLQGAPVSLEKALTMLYQVQVDKHDSPHTLKRTEYSGGHLCGHFGRLRDARTITLTETTDYMRKRRELGIKDSTIYRELRTLKEALTNLRKHGLYDGTPSLLWPTGLPQTFPGKDRWLTPEEFAKLLDALPERWRERVIVYTFAGLRLSELLRLEPGHCDFAKRQLHVPGTKTEGADRRIPMHPQVEAVLRPRCRKPGPLFPPNHASELASGGLNKALARACKRARIPHCSPNDLRRTFCSWCYQNGVDESDCARWLGHKNSTMVREVYGHDSPENAARKLSKVPSMPVSLPVSPEPAPPGGYGSN